MTTPINAEEPEAVRPPDATRSAPKKAKPKTRAVGIVVEHRSRGRTRMRLDKAHRTPEKMASIQAALNEHPDVESVKINERTGSVVIEHNEARDGREVIKETFSGVEDLAGLLLEVPVGEDEEEGGGGEYGKLDQRLADLASRADEWQAEKTGIHLRGALLSGAVAALGVAQVAIYGISLEMLPGPVLLYIAYDIHRKVQAEEKAQEALKKNSEPSGATGSVKPPAKGIQPAAA
jgi:hypothetical protein